MTTGPGRAGRGLLDFWTMPPESKATTPWATFQSCPATLRFDAAYKAADTWFKHRNEGGSATVITVGETCQRYVAKQRNEGKEAGAKDLEMRFSRWMHPDKKLSTTPITKLTQGQVNDWRQKLTKAPALLQDKI